MPATVTLTVTTGAAAGKHYQFTERTTALIGRESECHIRFPKDREHQSISRHHCLLDVNPPDVRVRDLGSRSGTFVNDRLIGKRDQHQSAAEASGLQFAEFTLQDGDEIKLGKTLLQVRVHVPAVCGTCAGEVPDDQQTRSLLPGGNYCCPACRSRPQPAVPAATTASRHACMRCGRDVAAEVGQVRQGEWICRACRSEPQQLARRLLELARTGTRDLLSIQGYRIERELGRGGMGAVYLAVHEATGAPRALKVMLPQVAANRRSRELFLREASTTRVLDHPHVVRLHDLGCCEGTFFFTLEYCEGGSLGRLLKKRGQPLPPDRAVPLILQALDGLDYAHQVELTQVQLADGASADARGLVHRDIKPDNLFLVKAGAGYLTKVGDYGLAKAFDLAGLSGLSVTGATAGTPVFMPRQQLAVYKYARPEVDVWAMAASLYYLLTLQYPRNFARGADPWQVVLQTSAVPIRQRNPAVPAPLAEVIDTALIDSPDITIKTARELKAALAAAVP